MKDAFKPDVPKLILASAGAIGGYFLPNGISSQDRDLARTVISVACALVAYGLVVAMPKVFALLAAKNAEFFIYGLRRWAEANAAAVAGDTVLNWFTDQLLAVQGRYAFSISCIAFLEDEGTKQIKCLMVRRPFAHLGDRTIWLWPGGRFRGLEDTIEIEIKRLVMRETGCEIALIPVDRFIGPQGGVFERVRTWSPSNDGAENELIVSPLTIMRQNRAQSNDVPGHIDLIYLAEVKAIPSWKESADWLHESEFNQSHHPPDQLWPDTRECIRRASAEFKRHVQSRRNVASSSNQ